MAFQNSLTVVKKVKKNISSQSCNANSKKTTKYNLENQINEFLKIMLFKREIGEEDSIIKKLVKEEIENLLLINPKYNINYLLKEYILLCQESKNYKISFFSMMNKIKEKEKISLWEKYNIDKRSQIIFLVIKFFYEDNVDIFKLGKSNFIDNIKMIKINNSPYQFDAFDRFFFNTEKKIVIEIYENIKYSLSSEYYIINNIIKKELKNSLIIYLNEIKNRKNILLTQDC